MNQFDIGENMEKVIIDAQALFEMQKSEIPPILEELREEIIKGTVQAIIPTVAIAELMWKMRKWGKLDAFKLAYTLWKQSPNIIIDNFDQKILDLMITNESSFELHDEIIAMTCLKYDTNIIYGRDWNFDKNFHLKLRKW